MKLLLKRFLQDLKPRNRFDCNKIVIVTSRRGGSTWLLETLAQSGKTEYSVQPFSFYSSDLNLTKFLPLPRDGVYTCLFPDELEAMRTYIDDLFRGKIKNCSRWDFWKLDFWIPAQTMILKITNSQAISHLLFDGYSNLKVIYQIRNPIDQAYSVMACKWRHHAHSFLDSNKFTKGTLSIAQFELSKKIIAKNNEFLNHILTWFFENIVPLNIHQSKNWMLVKYEDMKDSESFELLSKHLNININVNNTLKPSKTANISKAGSTEEFNAEKTKFLNTLSSETKEAINSLYIEFGVDKLYKKPF